MYRCLKIFMQQSAVAGHLINKAVFKMYKIIFKLQQAGRTNTIIKQAVNISPFFNRKGNTITLAVGNIAHPALKQLVAAWAMFFFVAAHICITS